MWGLTAAPGGEAMKHPSIAIAVAIGLMMTGVLLFATGARAHEQENSVEWEVAYANIRVLGPPVYTHYTTQALPLGGTRFTYIGQIGSNGYPTIPLLPDPGLATGDYINITWSFRYVAGNTVRGDLFWITRLGLDFGTVGRYINYQWIGASSFELVPNTQYTATLIIRSIQPTFRHLHVGVSVQNVGNIPAAPTVSGVNGNPPMPTLYGLFTNANGPVVEPLAGVSIAGSPFSGTFLLLTPWPWAVGGFAAQAVIGLVFIGAMYWYGRR